MSNNSNSNQSSLAKFAFNIYGTLNHSNSYDNNSTSPASSYSSIKSKVTENYDYRANKLVYNCEREVITLSQLNFQLHNLSNGYPSDHGISHHVVVGGRNYLRILALNDDQSRILQDINVLEQSTSQFNSRLPAINKLNNINTVKTHHDTIAAGLSNGLINVFKISPNGKSRLINKFSDHKRSINSLDFITNGSSFEPSNLFISGSQDGSIKLWDLRSSNPRPVITIMSSNHSDPVRSCQYSPHSTARNKMTILSAHDSGSLAKFELRSPSGNQLQNIISPERKWNLHTGPALSLHIHPEKEYVLTGGRDQKMCIWNYSDSNPSSNRVTPEHMINTYGPVMKVRWSQYPSLRSGADLNLENIQQSNEFNRFDDKLTYDEREALYSFPNSSTRGNSLYHYDFACSYLNDDSTITVYNLNRKYIPKEVITSATNKPFQNFIWPNNSTSSRKLWTVTKSNVFTTYDLDFQETSQDAEISRPLDDLPSTSITWNNGMGDFCFVNQDKYEYEMTDNESYASENDDSEELAIPLDRSNTNSVVEEEETKYYDDFERVVGSLPVPNPGFNSTNNSLASGSIEKPGLFRSSTQYSVNFTKSPSPNPRSTNTFSSFQEPAPLVRPKLHRNASTTTQESNISFGSTVHSTVPSSNNKKRLSYVNHLSPYVVPVSLPIPSNDDTVFEALADNYLVSIPDGFNLVDVCYLNASIAATVHRFRECQVWRMLAVSLEDDYVANAQQADIYTDNQREMIENNHKLEDEEYNKDAKSLSSDLGNFVGSYNSNSTSTTNYGGAGSHNGKDQSVDSLGKIPRPMKSTDDLQLHALSSKLSSNSLMELIHKSRGNSFTNASKSPEASNLFLRKESITQDDKLENAIIDDDETEDVESSSSPKDITFTGSNNNHEHSAPIAITSNESLPRTTTFESRYNRYSFTSQRRPTLTPSTHTSEDLDNENWNILNNAANNSSPVSNAIFLQQGSPNYFNQSHHSVSHHPYGSFSSRRNSAIQPVGFPRNKPSPGSSGGTRDETPKQALNQVQEEILSLNPSEKATIKSGLTRAFESSADPPANEVLKPWKVESLLKQVLEYSSQQGDVVFCATLALLFHDQYNAIISDEVCLDLISLYIEILQRKRLFVNCANVLNSCPKGLMDKIKELTINDVDLRFYCCWCEKLLVNEQSKEKLKDKRDEFGFWYCDECSKKQSNCIYCEEPCKGLTVVVSLKCGHRGHFGCLKEWFIEEENIVCPGGCDYQIL
ncbi:restriction of telomere capping protein 1 [Scheffersomyces coipomensis]|uniref:restriction of telomere capping protein 1 n=1 Tax=Scheffersomyces coipomensis TaxID=1788519 RepID=UPI00315DE5D9